jgi:tRNA 2-thiouridine synthesizing protein E
MRATCELMNVEPQSKGSGTGARLSIDEDKMADTVVIGNRTLALDKDGYLADLADWNVEVAEELARLTDIQLTDAHWEILNLIRDFHKRRGLAPVMRILVKLVENECGPEKGNSLYLLKLFPESPARVAAKIAGLPRPVNCL